MMPYRYALAITSQFYFCGIPFRLDTSPKCPLNCHYCFAMARGGRRTSVNLLVDPSFIFNKLYKLFTSKPPSIDVIGAFLLDKRPLHFGGMSDPFANELISSRSRELIKILAEFNYPTVLSTKNIKEFYEENTISSLKKLHSLIIQVSFSSSQKKSRILEPAIPDISERLKAIQLLSNEGFNTIARLQPLFPDDIEEVESELIPKLGEVGVKHVIVEFLKLPVEKNLSCITDLFREINWNGYEYYETKHCIRTGREWVLPPTYKWDLLQPIIEAIHKNGMTYGAGDYGLNHMSDTNCCCGIDAFTGFSNYFKNNIPYAIKNANSPAIRFDDLLNFPLPNQSIRMYMNSNCRTDDAFSIIDHLRLKWNRPGTENAPNTFLGVSWSGEVDENNNCVYFKSKV